MTHHAALFVAYAVACVLWLLVARWRKDLWPAGAAASFARPWREFAFALLAAFGIVGLGQLYQHGIRLPAAGSGAAAVAAENVNQLLIFSPVWMLLGWRRQGLSTVLVPRRRLWLRALIGLGLGAIAVAAHWLVRADAPPFLATFAQVCAPMHLRYLAQIAMEDLAIAMLLVRAAAATGGAARIAALVGTLFAAGHVPALLADGAGADELCPLLLDALLATGVCLCLLRGRDVSWFVGVHFALDMTQFLAGGR